jgi:hypothetical protein
MSVLLGAFLGVLGILVGILGLVSLYKGLLAARELTRDDGRLRLKEVARARGLLLPPKTEAAIDARALAVRRCVACRRKERCDELAAARDWAALRAICPNTPYLDDLPAR